MKTRNLFRQQMRENRRNSSSSMAYPKHQKLQNRAIGFDDRISRLPDEILCQILSSLSAKRAAQTAVLSKRWRNLWALVPNLILEVPGNLSPCSVTNFINFLDNALSLRDGMPIRKFCLWFFPESTAYYERFHDCIRTVIRCHVERLDLKFPGPMPMAMDSVKFPWNQLMNCKTLVELKLTCNSLLVVPMDVMFPSLKTLHLISLTYSDDASVGRLFSCCPLLEELVVKRLSDNTMKFNVSIPMLRRLKYSLETYVAGIGNGRELIVDAPYLEYLHVSYNTYEKYVFGNFSSIVEAHVNVQKKCDRGIGLLKCISAVKTLSLSASTMAALGFTDKSVSPTFCNLVHLSIKADGIKWRLLSSLLKNTPNLEVLIFDKGRAPEIQRIDDDIELIWDHSESVPACLLLTVHTIEFRNNSFLLKQDMRLIMYLLANAFSLKTFKICEHNMTRKIRKELLSYPRVSDSCLLVLVPYRCFFDETI